MKKSGIFYGSATGTTAEVANKIAALMNVDSADVLNVATTEPSRLGDYENIILGSSTWGSGELEDDWYDFLAGAEALDLEGRRIAVFGCGDESMSDTFCDAVGEIYDRMKATGATMVGTFNADGYNFSASRAQHDGKMVGLVIDEVNHPDLTDARIDAWTAQLAKEMA